MASYYEDRLNSVALHFYTSNKNANECAKKAADAKGMVWGDVLVAIFLSIPEKLRNFYLLIQDDLRNETRIMDMMKKADYSTGLYYLRVHARRNAQTYTLVEMYDIFTSKHTDPIDNSRAWEAIELGISERHTLYKREAPLEFSGESIIFSTMTSLVDLFHKKGKTWITQYYQPPAVSGVRFLSTILLTHFGQSLLHSKEIDLDEFAKSPLFKKPRGIKKNADAKEKILELYSAAVGVYASDPEKIHVEGLSKSIVDDYRYFNPSHQQ